jgi:hypothetical protein
MPVTGLYWISLSQAVMTLESPKEWRMRHTITEWAFMDIRPRLHVDEIVAGRETKMDISVWSVGISLTSRSGP